MVGPKVDLKVGRKVARTAVAKAVCLVVQWAPLMAVRSAGQKADSSAMKMVAL